VISQSANSPSLARAEKPCFSVGWGWVALSLALAIHVLDEASHDFLSFYNPIAARIRESARFLPIPTFTFRTWLAGLISAVVLLLALSPFAFAVDRGRSRWFGWPAVILAALMTLNGLTHIAGMIYYRWLVPGIYSAPLLLVASGYLFLALRRTQHDLEQR